mmetsp:Transcript_84456/g.169027  ORF Transcript_84456/g.169027 Transcript_84456/m.169027 type:complete len:349 (-) Transcript_84456:214-1260(-)
MMFRRRTPASKLLYFCAAVLSQSGSAFLTAPRCKVACKNNGAVSGNSFLGSGYGCRSVVLGSTAGEVRELVADEASASEKEPTGVEPTGEEQGMLAEEAASVTEDQLAVQGPVGAEMAFEPEDGVAADDDGSEEDRSRWSKEDFIKSEWKIAIMWEGSNKPQETWIRFVDDFELEWGLNAKGTWEMSGQFLSFSRDFAFGIGGKRIFGAKLSRKQNEVYIDGLVRGWSPIAPANVMGQFQAMRLNVDRKEYGIPYWNTVAYQNEGLDDGSSADDGGESLGEESGGVGSSEKEEEEPPFWTGLTEGLSGLGNTLFPPGTPTAEAFRKATEDASKEEEAKKGAQDEKSKP